MLHREKKSPVLLGLTYLSLNFYNTSSILVTLSLIYFLNISVLVTIVFNILLKYQKTCHYNFSTLAECCILGILPLMKSSFTVLNIGFNCTLVIKDL